MLSIILAKFAWKPLLAMLDERNKSIEDSLLSAEKARKELENINQESEVILTKAKTEAQSIISDAKSVRNLKEDIVSKQELRQIAKLKKLRLRLMLRKIRRCKK